MFRVEQENDIKCGWKVSFTFAPTSPLFQPSACSQHAHNSSGMFALSVHATHGYLFVLRLAYFVCFSVGESRKTLRNYFVHISYHSINITFAYVNHFAFSEEVPSDTLLLVNGREYIIWREMRWNRASWVARLDVLRRKLKLFWIFKCFFDSQENKNFNYYVKSQINKNPICESVFKTFQVSRLF